MTERFIADGDMVRDIEGKIPTILTHDKKQLNNFLTGLNELYDKCEFLEIENESLEDGATKYAELYHQSLKENEQLKQELAIYRKLASCSNCEYHNYDWYDDGDEFEVCDKGNDVTEGICKDWVEL